MERIHVPLTVILTVVCLSSVEANVFSLGSMIEWLDPRLSSVFGVYKRFNEYGCYCGIGGHGEPIDPVDCCCQAHDECYDDLVNEHECTTDGTFSHLYRFKKGHKGAKWSISCSPSPDDPCAFHLCECDRKLAQCFAASEPYYNDDHKHYAREEKCAEGTLRADVCDRLHYTP